MATLLKTWSTYYMRSDTDTPSNGDIKGKIQVYLENQNSTNNYSDLRIDHYFTHYYLAGTMSSLWSYGTVKSNYRANNGSYGGTYKSTTYKDGLNGVLFWNGGANERPCGDYVAGTDYYSTTHRVYHNADGTCQLYVNGSISANITANGILTNHSTNSAFNIALPTITPPDPNDIRIKVSGTWRTGKTYIRVSGVWKRATGVYTKVSSVWKKGI